MVLTVGHSTPEIVEVLRAATGAVEDALGRQRNWGLTGSVWHQYHHDTVADEAAVKALTEAGLGVFSEESGLHNPERPVVVVLDPVDGSTNASRGLPWWAISMCAVDGEGPLAAVVSCPPTGERFEAVRGEGATRNGRPARPSGAEDIGESVITFNGYPQQNYGWAFFRTLGAAAMDLCAVACGAVDGFVDCSANALAPWDYMGGLLICREAGAVVSEVYGRDLVITGPGQRRALVAAATESLAAALLAHRTAS